MADTPTNSQPVRPPLVRGNTVPLYVRTPSTPTPELQWSQGDSSSGPYSAHPDRLRSPEPWQANANIRRDQPNLYPQASAYPTARIGQHFQLGAYAPTPTPPLTTSPGSIQSADDNYFPPMQAVSSMHQGAYPSSSTYPRASGNSSKPPGPSAFPSAIMSPTITSSPTSFQLLRNTRGPNPQASAPMRIDTTLTEHILSAVIGPGFDSNCITIAMRKNNVLDIVADRWNLEKDCHHEWQVQFDRDADMNGVRASYTDGVLTVTVKRLHHHARPPQMRQ